MKKIYTIIFIFIFGVQCTNAQNIGHLGKRFLVNMDATFSPSFKYPDKNGYHGYLNFNYRLSPSIEFILNKKNSIGVFYSYAPLMFIPSKLIFNHSIVNTPMNVNGYGVFYKAYFSDDQYHAPYGAYFMTSLSRISFQYESIIIGNGKGANYALQIEFGYNFLIYNRLRLTWGITFGGTTSWFNFGIDEDFVPIQKKLKTPIDFAENRIFGTYIFGTRIGIGFLAF